MPSSIRIGIIAALLWGSPLPTGAQSPARDSSWQRPSDQRRPCAPALDVYRSQVRSLSHHAGWGMFVGGVLGTAYGLAHAKGPLRGAIIIWDGLIGGTSGMVVGSGVYSVRRLRGYSPPLQTSCGVPPNEASNLSALVEPAGSLRSPAAIFSQRRSPGR